MPCQGWCNEFSERQAFVGQSKRARHGEEVMLCLSCWNRDSVSGVQKVKGIVELPGDLWVRVPKSFKLTLNQGQHLL